MRSSIIKNEDNSRQEFKDKTLKRVYDALNKTANIKAANCSVEEVTVKGLRPRKREEG